MIQNLPLPKYKLNDDFIIEGSYTKIRRREIVLDYDAEKYVIYYYLVRKVDNNWEKHLFKKLTESELNDFLGKQNTIITSEDVDLPEWWNPKFKIGEIINAYGYVLLIKKIEYINNEYHYIFSKHQNNTWSKEDFYIKAPEQSLLFESYKSTYDKDNLDSICKQYGFRGDMYANKYRIFTNQGEWMIEILYKTKVILWHKNTSGDTTKYHEQFTYPIKEKTAYDIIKYIYNHDKENIS